MNTVKKKGEQEMYRNANLRQQVTGGRKTKLNIFVLQAYFWLKNLLQSAFNNENINIHI